MSALASLAPASRARIKPNLCKEELKMSLIKTCELFHDVERVIVNDSRFFAAYAISI